MKKNIRNVLILFIAIYSSFQPVIARKGYTKKPAYAGLGKPSKANGRIKVKSTSGHFKKTSKGYTYVNTYSRSK